MVSFILLVYALYVQAVVYFLCCYSPKMFWDLVDPQGHVASVAAFLAGRHASGTCANCLALFCLLDSTSSHFLQGVKFKHLSCE
eukprot:636651-Pelagomonas_calceolata.AAC.2